MPTENTGLPAVCAVIVAAGSSRRMGGENKLLMPLCGRPGAGAYTGSVRAQPCGT